jgi:anaerobic magnesium-protoporphyrin IX monomethyl ester cyclase
MELGEKQNWDDSSDLAMLYQGPFGTAFYRQLHSLLHHEFRLRKAWHRERIASAGSRWEAHGAVPICQPHCHAIA